MSDPQLREWARALVKRAGRATAHDVTRVMRIELARMAAEPHADLTALQREAAHVDEQWLRLPVRMNAHGWCAYTVAAVTDAVPALAESDDVFRDAALAFDEDSEVHRLLTVWAQRMDWTVES